MKRRILYIILVVLFVCLVFSCDHFPSRTEPSTVVNYYLQGLYYRDDGLDMIIVNEGESTAARRINMIPVDDTVSFADLTDGDVIKIEYKDIEEIWPPQTYVYSVEKVSDGNREDISYLFMSCWWDCYRNPSITSLTSLLKEQRETTVEDFPNVTFRWAYDKLEAVVGDEVTTLYTGMPIWNVFLTELTGDGMPELCSTISYGSGMIDERVVVYDYVNGASYELRDRLNYNYVLSQQDGKLLVTKSDYNTFEVIETGFLIL